MIWMINGFRSLVYMPQLDRTSISLLNMTVSLGLFLY